MKRIFRKLNTSILRCSLLPIFMIAAMMNSQSTLYNMHNVNEPVIAEVEIEETINGLTSFDIDLIALVTMAEAEGECEYGKRLVIDTILNRMNHDYWPDTVYDVIYQPSQFSSIWNGRVDRCYVMDDIRELVVEEVKNRSNYDVVFFTADKYGKYGTPMFQVGNHYFARY